MSEYLIQGETLTNIADAIREKKGTSDVILVSAFADEISTIETGSGGGGGMLTASTEEEMTALITTENEGKIVLYSGETGEYVNGEYYKITSSGDNTQYYDLAELANPATAEDIASGKEAYGADGAVITGTASSGYELIEGTISLTTSASSIEIQGIPRKPVFVMCYCGSGEFETLAKNDTLVWWTTYSSLYNANFVYCYNVSSKFYKGTAGASYNQWLYDATSSKLTLKAFQWTTAKSYTYKIFY